MPSSHKIKQNDTRPYWQVDLEYSDGTGPDLSGASVRFIATDRSDGVKKVDVATTIINASSPATVEWRPTATETAVAGRYAVEWEATLSDGTIQTFPTKNYDRLTIVADLG